MEYQNYKELHESFVSNHNGTSTYEVAILASSAPVAVLFRNIFVSFFAKSCSKRNKFMIDFVCLVMPSLLSATVLSSYTEMLLVTLLSISMGMHIFSDDNTGTLSDNTSQESSSLLDVRLSGRRPFITHFRAYVYIATALTILAVDFVIFPRRFCKAETYGTGFMDVGVGSFVVASAIVSPEARGRYPEHRSLIGKLGSIVMSLKSYLPLVFLGICRLLAVKAADYQEHVSEYGVHWNFFFTLVLVKVLSTCILCWVNHRHSWLVAMVIAVAYQYMLTGVDLRELVLHGSDGKDGREGLLDANREGLASSLGYLAIYFAGVQLGKYLFQPRETLGEWVRTHMILVLLDLIFWFLLWVSDQYIEPVSRRMANLPYVIWMMAYNMQLIASFLFVDLITVVFHRLPAESTNTDGTTEESFCLLEATNANGLIYFLIANLLTGAVNKSISTIYTAPDVAFIVVTAYLLLLSIIFSFLYIKHIRIKLW